MRTYVFRGARPQAESGTDSTGRPTNGAGIDLGERVWSQLGMLDNGLSRMGVHRRTYGPARPLEFLICAGC